MTQKCYTAMKYRINFLQLSNSREYIFLILCMQPDVAYYDLVVLHLLQLFTIIGSMLGCQKHEEVPAFISYLP